MGKKNNKGGAILGRALIKNQQQNSRGRKRNTDTLLHTTEIQDGYDWGRLNLQSVTEESSFQEFLSTAELAGTEFANEKLNIKFVNPATNIGLLTEEETKKIKDEHDKNKGQLTIPRRPAWTPETTASELQLNEHENFLQWRRKLAVLQEENQLLMTPYEKNLEFWRQLWRVVERSDVVVQIVDARNPLLFRCEDLEKYVKEVSINKLNLILINKADFLTEDQRKAWLNYFTSIGVNVAFFSAVLAAAENDKIEEESNEDESSSEYESSDATSDEENTSEISDKIQKLDQAVKNTENKLKSVQNEVEKALENLQIPSVNSEGDVPFPTKKAQQNEEQKSKEISQENEHLQQDTSILTKKQLIQLFKTIHTGPKVTEGVTTIGLVGYPNVGKSSTINTLMEAKKVSVSATPGKTKHFQTLYLDQDILLCDCPGLVMPSFVFTKAEMIINGILPIDQMRDHVPAINLVAKLIPRHIFEDQYGILLPKPSEEEENPDRPPTSEELLNAYGYIRGFMTANGQPDNARSARYVLKDFVKGKLLYATAPPNMKQEDYHIFPERYTKPRNDSMLPPREVRAVKSLKPTGADVDKVFFNRSGYGLHTKGKMIIPTGETTTTENISSKPWKKMNKHLNKNKREKLRRVYSHLDQH
ncbi:large subunit GTPase 1 homolog [Chrysoperla carnea]|uniref:large subunit GTPase 1 homolog n=1 Tax=Chrysoperla carnea TaxID=189513 RepID=UPI001D06C701|nr:large subunit GTPase 1 homolog [Chrysoperla carnea]